MQIMANSLFKTFHRGLLLLPPLAGRLHIVPLGPLQPPLVVHLPTLLPNLRKLHEFLDSGLDKSLLYHYILLTRLWCDGVLSWCSQFRPSAKAVSSTKHGSSANPSSTLPLGPFSKLLDLQVILSCAGHIHGQAWQRVGWSCRVNDRLPGLHILLILVFLS